MADEKTTVADEPIATLERHVSMACSGTGKSNVGTQGVLAGVEWRGSGFLGKDREMDGP